MHPEFQIYNKLVGNIVLVHAKIYDEVADEQHGSMKDHQARLLVLNQTIVGDCLLLSKRAGYYCMNNANGCFDQINHIPTIRF